MKQDNHLNLLVRNGLPEDQLFLAETYPKRDWDRHRAVAGLARTWLTIHDSFRGKLSSIDIALTSVLEQKRAAEEILPRFQSDMRNLLSHLDQHHHIEDHHYFPQFQMLEPRLVRGFELMDADHHVIAESIFRLSSASRAFIDHVATTAPERSEIERAVQHLHEVVAVFDRHMHRHLDDEEDLVIPLVIDRNLG